MYAKKKDWGDFMLKCQRWLAMMSEWWVYDLSFLRCVFLKLPPLLLINNMYSNFITRKRVIQNFVLNTLQHSIVVGSLVDATTWDDNLHKRRNMEGAMCLRSRAALLYRALQWRVHVRGAAELQYLEVAQSGVTWCPRAQNAHRAKHKGTFTNEWGNAI